MDWDDVRFRRRRVQGEPLRTRSGELGIVVIFTDFSGGISHLFGDLFDAVNHGEAVAPEAVAEGVGAPFPAGGLFEAAHRTALLTEDSALGFAGVKRAGGVAPGLQPALERFAHGHEPGGADFAGDAAGDGDGGLIPMNVGPVEAQDFGGS